MPIRHDDERDAYTIADINEVVRLSEEEYGRFLHFNELAHTVGATYGDLASAISDFMSRLNSEYFEDETVEEISFDELMCFSEEGI